MKNDIPGVAQNSVVSSSADNGDLMFFGKVGNAISRVTTAIAAARDHLFSIRQEDGYWCGELEADTTLESDYILLHTLLGTGNAARFEKAARYILNHQNEDGARLSRS